MSESVDLYQVLGVSHGASQDEIRNAYKKLAVQYHPDKNPDGEEKFKEIVHAYRSLSDPEVRALYDCNKRKFTWKDLHVELSPKDLREFVSDLLRSEREEEMKRMAFEKRREEEMARRAAFDAAHPNFRPSSTEDMHTPGKTLHDLRQQFLSSLSSENFCKQPERKEKPRPAESSGAQQKDLSALLEEVTAQGLSYKQQQLESFRRRATEGRGEAALETSKVFSRAGFASEQFPTGPDGAPLADTEVLKKAFSTFDYEQFVVESRAAVKAERERLSDAILADALTNYDFQKSISSES